MTADKEEIYTVGPNGDFASVQEALDASWVATQGNDVTIIVSPDGKIWKERNAQNKE